MSGRVRYWFIACFLVGLSTSPPALAQDTPVSDGAPYRPYFLGGLSHLLADVGEDNHPAIGPTGDIGLQFPGSSIGLAFSYWRNVNRIRLASLQLDFAQEFTDWGRFSPQLLVGVGHTWATHLDTSPVSPPNGASAAFGVGVHTMVTSRVAIDSDFRIRTDAGGWNGEWRVLAGVSSGEDLRPVANRRTTAYSSWMTSLGGPWVAVEPAWGLRVAQDAGILSARLIHWQIPREGPSGGYVWDTRGIIATAQSEESLFADRFSLRFGPAISAMGEGPDNGVSFGGEVNLVAGFNVKSAYVEGGLGYLWLNRSGDGDSSDQNGLTVFIGLGT